MRRFPVWLASFCLALFFYVFENGIFIAMGGGEEETMSRDRYISTVVVVSMAKWKIVATGFLSTRSLLYLAVDFYWRFDVMINRLNVERQCPFFETEMETFRSSDVCASSMAVNSSSFHLLSIVFFYSISFFFCFCFFLVTAPLPPMRPWIPLGHPDRNRPTCKHLLNLFNCQIVSLWIK